MGWPNRGSAENLCRSAFCQAFVGCRFNIRLPAPPLFHSWIHRERILKRRLSPIVKRYDYILLDCPPEPNIFNLNSIFFADELFLPVSVDYLSASGVADVFKQLEFIKQQLDLKTRVSLIIPTFFATRERNSQHYLGVLKKHFGEAVTEPIRKNVRIAEAAQKKKTIFEAFPHSSGAEDYNKLVERVINYDGKK